MKRGKIDIDRVSEAVLLIDYLKYASNVNLLQGLSLYGNLQRSCDGNVESLVFTNLRQTYLNCIQDMCSLIRSMMNRYSVIDTIKKYNKRNKGKPKEYPQMLPLLLELSKKQNETIPSSIQKDMPYDMFLKLLGLHRSTYKSSVIKTKKDEDVFKKRVEIIQVILKDINKHLTANRDILNKVKHGKAILNSNTALESKASHEGPVVVYERNGEYFYSGTPANAKGCELFMRLIWQVTSVQKDLILFYIMAHYKKYIEQAKEEFRNSYMTIQNIMKEVGYKPPHTMKT